MFLNKMTIEYSILENHNAYKGIRGSSEKRKSEIFRVVLKYFLDNFNKSIYSMERPQRHK